jgi:hypothetical protein
LRIDRSENGPTARFGGNPQARLEFDAPFRVASVTMSSFWAMFWLIVVLKVPIAALLYIVWWATREPPLPEPDPGEGGKGITLDPHPRLRPPQPPRRGPHAGRRPDAPSRTRVGTRARRLPKH